MSVLIKGLKMPESCNDCEFWYRDASYYGGCLVFDGREADFNDETNTYIRQPWCPLAEVPPHGRPVVRCRDCMYWRDAYVKLNDGRERQYTDDDDCGLFLWRTVTCDVGINMGAMCRLEDGRGWNVDKSVFRNADDFCSRGRPRPCSYEQWWGIVDGYYPER